MTRFRIVLLVVGVLTIVTGVVLALTAGGAGPLVAIAGVGLVVSALPSGAFQDLGDSSRDGFGGGTGGGGMGGVGGGGCGSGGGSGC